MPDGVMALWPSGSRRKNQDLVLIGAGSNPVGVTSFSFKFHPPTTWFNLKTVLSQSFSIAEDDCGLHPHINFGLCMQR